MPLATLPRSGWSPRLRVTLNQPSQYAESVAGGAMAAIAMFSRTLALEVKRHGIRVHAVTPSLIAGTPTADRLLAHEFGRKVFEKVIAKAALGVPDADDVAETVLWLASPGAAKVTGQVISVNGRHLDGLSVPRARGSASVPLQADPQTRREDT